MPEITIRKRPQAEAVITQRKFFRKTARGKVIKVLRERYLRTDVSCGVQYCSSCSQLDHFSEGPSKSPSEPLPQFGDKSHISFPDGHFVLPDSNIFLAQMDLLESSLFRAPIIVLQTVMEEIRHRSLPLFNRLRTLIHGDEKKIWVFYNEFRSETAVVREVDETPNDRNDRGIRNATAWYNEHIQTLCRATNSSRSKSRTNPPAPTVVLITNDVANRRKAEKEKIPCSSLRRYIEGSKDATQLMDLLAATGVDEDDEGKADREIQPTEAEAARKEVYDEHLPVSILLAGIKAKTLHQGHFTANQYNYLESTVSVPAFQKPVLILGRMNMNRAVQGDVVCVEVFPESEWRAPGDEVVERDATLKDDDAGDEEDEEGEEMEADVAGRERRKSRLEAQQEEERLKRQQERQPTGRVIGIIKRNWRPVVCHIDPITLPPALASGTSTSRGLAPLLAIPASPLLPRIRIRTRQAPSLIGQKLLVAIDTWPANKRNPEGHLVRKLGAVGDKDTEQESLMLEFGVVYAPFGKRVMECLPEEDDKWVVPPKPKANQSDVDVKAKTVWRDREDLRDMIICSIDPPGCQDIDDALHARHLPNGNIEAGVHIADVSNFVLPDTPMDTEAASRGTTVYLVDKRVDMLPALLGTNLCSLRPHVERLAFSAIWELTPDADIVNVRFAKSVIASKAAFTYEEAQIRKDDPHLQDELTTGIRLLNSLAIKLKAKRMAAGALNLASPEVKIHLDSAESSDPIDVEQKELRETNSLVEEFMLLANVSVARKIQETFPQTAVLRRHMPPPKGNFEKLQDILMKRKGLSLDVSSSGALAASLDLCLDPSEPAFNTLVRIMATRCMLSAEYFCSGSVSRDTFGHYGLASPIYTHFTSPIRRYADVLAHRQLAAAIGYTTLHPSLHSAQNVDRILDVVNRRHRMAQMASRASVEFYVGLALKQRREAQSEAGVQEEAFVIRTFRNGVGVFVNKLGIEGVVMFKRDATDFDADNYTISIPNSKGTGNVDIGVFDKVTVRIEVEKDKNTQRGRVKMTLVRPVISSAL
ncbi:exosome catalytic subunit dis3 [Pleurotus pulmonarius]|nr:exosome catalytic subunit dis3 [Pleurotus pulmonarius]